MTKSNNKIPPNVLEEAADWVTRTEAGMHGAETAAALESWLRESPEHRAAFDRMRGLWDSKVLTEAVRPSSAPTPKAPVWRAGPRVWATAASVCIALLTATVFMMVEDAPEVTVYATDIAETRDVVLLDGTTVSLNAASILEVSLSGRRRQAELQEGEAFFDVAHDAGRPFFVVSDGARIRVVGTRFNVNRLSDHSEIAVHAGKVRLSSDGPQKRPLFLTAGQAAAVESTDIVRLPDFEVPAVVSWRNDWIDADSTPLPQVLEHLNRYLEAPARIADSELERLTVAGRFRLSKPRETLAMLAALYDLRIEDSGDHCTLRKP